MIINQHLFPLTIQLKRYALGLIVLFFSNPTIYSLNFSIFVRKFLQSSKTLDCLCSLTNISFYIFLYLYHSLYSYLKVVYKQIIIGVFIFYYKIVNLVK